MKKFAMLALVLSLGLFSIGCEAKKASSTAPAAAPADGKMSGDPAPAPVEPAPAAPAPKEGDTK